MIFHNGRRIKIAHRFLNFYNNSFWNLNVAQFNRNYNFTVRHAARTCTDSLTCIGVKNKEEISTFSIWNYCSGLHSFMPYSYLARQLYLYILNVDHLSIWNGGILTVLNLSPLIRWSCLHVCCLFKYMYQIRLIINFESRILKIIFEGQNIRAVSVRRGSLHLNLFTVAWVWMHLIAGASNNWR